MIDISRDGIFWEGLKFWKIESSIVNFCFVILNIRYREVCKKLLEDIIVFYNLEGVVKFFKKIFILIYLCR